MPDLRRTALLIAAPVGLGLGGLAWVVFLSGRAEAHRLDAVEAALQSAPRAQRSAAVASPPIAQILNAPLFALTTGPGAVAEAVVRLEGLSRAGGRQAALLSIDGKPAQWLELGATRDGVTLSQVMGSKVVVDTVTGLKEVPLGGQSSPQPSSSAAG